MTENPRERVWLAAGALVGVIVAGVGLAIVIILASGKPTAQLNPGESTRPEPPSTSATGSKIVGTRDDSLKAAEAAAVAVNTLDYTAAEAGLDHWESVATGQLLEDLKARRADSLSSATKTRTSTSAKVLAIAVARIAPDNSSTDVLAAVEVTTTAAKSGQTVKQARLKLTMTNTAQGWKLSAITQVEPG